MSQAGNENTTSRRRFITGTAAVLATSGAIAAAPDDPVFAAIEAHKRANAAASEYRDARAKVEKALGMKDWPWGWANEPEYSERWKVGTREVMTRWWTLEVEDEALDALLSTPPTTEAGRAAFARYGYELDDGDDALRFLAVLAGLPDPSANYDDEEAA